MLYIEFSRDLLEENLLPVNLWRSKKKFMLLLLVVLQTAKVRARVSDKCLVKKEKAHF